MNKSKQLTEGVLLTGIFVVLLLVAVFVPVLSFIATFILAVPFIIFTAKYDWKPSLIMLGVCIILTILFATILSLPIPLLAGLGGIMIGSAIYHDRTPYETWARGTIGFALGILIALLFTMFVLDVNVLEEFNNQVDEVLVLTEQIIQQFGMGEVSDEQVELLERQLLIYKQLVPVGIVLISIGLALLNVWLSYKLLNRIENRKLYFPKFRNLRFPISVIWIYLLAILGSLFQNDVNSTLFIALQNVVMLTGFLMVLQGLSFIFYFTDYKKLSKAIPIVAVVLTVLFAPLFLPIVRILGIIDLGFGLRDRMVK